MRLAIKGVTGATITFNTLGLILRGTEATIQDINTSEKEAEIRELEINRLIRTINVDEMEKRKAEIDTEQRELDGGIDEDPQSNYIEHIEYAEQVEQVEDAPAIEDILEESAQVPEVEESEDVADESEDVAEVVEDIEVVTAKVAVVPVPSPATVSSLEIPKEASNVTIHTGERVITGKMVNASGPSQAEDTEQVRASLDAMKILEDEEREANSEDKPDPTIGKFEANGQMGRKATVATAEGQAQPTMRNSVVPEADPVRDPFIDRKEKAEDNSAEAFIDEIAGGDEKSEEFIEC